ncbi:hypothetical protein [Sneathia sanguinegens]|uniref:hypothetical protein n=1 Tax=Sneathia sanguinegens TaxID=40543 RepID=UPI00288C4A76|nr:hypothetical protein [Sneathia sanguinegens]MDU4652532.1 hypothetical protein [Sneathia sanguinegens]
MKKIVMILMMMITFVGFASNKPKDNFNYDKYVGSYVMKEYYTNNGNNYLAFQIKKKGNDYIYVDFQVGSGYNKKIYCTILKKHNGSLLLWDTVLTEKNGEIINRYPSGWENIYAKATEKDIKYHFSSPDFKNIKYILEKQ